MHIENEGLPGEKQISELGKDRGNAFIKIRRLLSFLVHSFCKIKAQNFVRTNIKLLSFARKCASDQEHLIMSTIQFIFYGIFEPNLNHNS